jgi:hypothetical protein
MSRIFLTGMSAPQASSSANLKNLSFAGLINMALTDAGHEVVWASPSVYMTKETLDEFDAVVVGVSPITSMGANRVYGALNVIQTMWGSDKLTLFVDTPTPSQIEVSLKSVINNPESLTKSFFSYRKEYSNVVADKKLLDNTFDAVNLLYKEDWQKTVYAKLPWKSLDSVKMAPNFKKNLVGLNLDSYILSELDVDDAERVDKWVYDSSESPWYKNQLQFLKLPTLPMKINRGSSDLEVTTQLLRSVGALISPDRRDGTAWSNRYIQALNTKTPIITEWKESGVLGDAWAVLAYSIEEMSQSRRDLVSLAQRESYLANIPDKTTALKNLESTLNIGK